MGSLEFVLSLVACFQPLVIGALVVVGLGRLSPPLGAGGRAGGLRGSTSAFRFFECASYSRLSSRLHYNMQTFSICLAFLLYDIDLFFFFAESTHLDSNSIYELCLLAIFLGLFMFGLWFDYTRFGFEWAF
jgi:NADH:ubiquinone oxidoreductase subunit 3 (subunit A)